MSRLKKSIRPLFERVFVSLMPGILCCVVAANFCPVAAVTVPPESALPEEESPPPEIAPEPEPSPQPEDPFREPPNPGSYEEMKQRREKRTIIIILAVVVLLCAYWLISGRLHQRLPREN